MRRHVYFYTHVPEPFEAAAGTLAAAPSRWLPPPAEANGEGWRVALYAEGALPPRLARRVATVSLEEPVVDDERLLMPLSWQAVEWEPLFPVLRADLALDALGGLGCHLSLMGTYRPPLSVVGGAADALHGHRVAEAVIRRFVLDVADRVTDGGAP